MDIILDDGKYKLALKIATKAHEGQFDKAGNHYIEHPVFVASLFENEDEKITALLHDVIEDTDITIEDLKLYGFNEMILEALELLNHNKRENYYDYIEKIKANKLATKIKLGDLKHNSDLGRIKNPTEKDIKRIEKYSKATNMLERDK